jgi:hypothetical protein
VSFLKNQNQVGSAAELALMAERLHAHIGSLRNTLYGKRIYAKLLKQFPQLAAAAAAQQHGC